MHPEPLDDRFLSLGDYAGRLLEGNPSPNSHSQTGNGLQIISAGWQLSFCSKCVTVAAIFVQIYEALPGLPMQVFHISV